MKDVTIQKVNWDLISFERESSIVCNNICLKGSYWKNTGLLQSLYCSSWERKP